MSNDNYVPINPWITIASGNAQLTENLPEIRPAIETIYPDHEAENKETKQDNTKIPGDPQTSFSGYSS